MLAPWVPGVGVMAKVGRPRDPRKISSQPTPIKFDERTEAIMAEDLAAMKKRGLRPNRSEVVRRWARVSNEGRMREFIGEILDETRVGSEAIGQLQASNERMQAKLLQYERREQARRSKQRRRLLDLILRPGNRDRLLPILREYAANEAGGFRAPAGVKLLDEARDVLGDGSWQQLLELVEEEDAEVSGA